MVFVCLMCNELTSVAFDMCWVTISHLVFTCYSRPFHTFTLSWGRLRLLMKPETPRARRYKVSAWLLLLCLTQKPVSSVCLLSTGWNWSGIRFKLVSCRLTSGSSRLWTCPCSLLCVQQGDTDICVLSVRPLSIAAENRVCRVKGSIYENKSKHLHAKLKSWDNK